MILSKENMNSVQNSRLMAGLRRPDAKEWKHKVVLQGNKQLSSEREEDRDHTDIETEKNRDSEGGWRINTVKDKEGGKWGLENAHSLGKMEVADDLSVPEALRQMTYFAHPKNKDK